MKPVTPPVPSIFDFLDYRHYLQALYDYHKAYSKGFSVRAFCKKSGVGSPHFLRMVIEGSRGMLPETIQKFVKGFNLKGRERRYFEALVGFNQAKNEEERARFATLLADIRPQEKVGELDDIEHEYLSKPYYVVLREMISLPDFKEDPEWILKRIEFPLRPLQIKKAFDHLIRLGLIKRNSDGKLFQETPNVKTKNETTAAGSYHYHASMLEMAKMAMWKVDPKKRDMNAITIPVEKNLLPEIKKRVNTFLEELMRFMEHHSKSADEIYQIGFQIFPLTLKKEEK